MNLSKILSKRKLWLVTFVAIGLGLVLVWRFMLPSPPQPITIVTPSAKAPAVAKQPRVAYGFPVRLKIPSINVDGPVEYVGLTPKGGMDVPKNPSNGAWYDRGPRPGEIGSSVIAGHYGWRNNIPAIFDNLSKLAVGDRLYVEDEKGATIAFIVRESRSYHPAADASAVFFSSDKKAHLNLITCEGSWSRSGASYSNRRVVFADME